MFAAALFLISGALAQSEPAMPTADMLVWPAGETRRFYSTMAFRSPYVLRLIAVRNEERSAAELALSAVFRCESLGLMRGATEVRCQVEDAGVQATPMRSDAGQLQQVLNEWELAAEAATVYFRIREDGRVDRVRLEDLPDSGPRERYISGKLEVYMERLLSPLDLELPEEGEATWKHRSPAVGNLPFEMTGASLRLSQSAVQEQGTVLVSGSGTGQAVGQHTFTMEATSQHRLDPECHCIRRASVEVRGVATMDTGHLAYRMGGYIEDIGERVLDEPLTSWDLSVPRLIP
jgi:hypothetical protein